jgi:integrase
VREIEMARVSSYVFPGKLQGRPFSNMAFLTLLKRMNGVEKKWVDATTGKPITAHGFRATFRTWAEEVATVPHAVIEQAMGIKSAVGSSDPIAARISSKSVENSWMFGRRFAQHSAPIKSQT